MFSITTGDVITWIALIATAVAVFKLWHDYDEKSVREDLYNELRRNYEKSIWSKEI